MTRKEKYFQSNIANIQLLNSSNYLLALGEDSNPELTQIIRNADSNITAFSIPKEGPYPEGYYRFDSSDIKVCQDWLNTKVKELTLKVMEDQEEFSIAHSKLPKSLEDKGFKLHVGINKNTNYITLVICSKEESIEKGLRFDTKSFQEAEKWLKEKVEELTKS